MPAKEGEGILTLKNTGQHHVADNHKKCDEERPSCRRCIDLILDCPGYRTDKDLEFRDQTNRYSQKVRIDSLPTAMHSKDASPVNEVLLPKGSEITTSLPTFFTARHNLSTSHKFNIICQFFDAYLPKDISAEVFSVSSYLLLIQDSEESSCCCTALLALASAHLGTHLGNIQIASEAFFYYGVAMQSLYRHLANATRSNKENILLTITLLSECEELQITHSGRTGLPVHILGARDFFLYCSSQHQSKGLETLYFTILHRLFCLQLIRRNAVDFKPPAWLKKNVNSLDVFQQLLLLIEPIPGLLASIDLALSAPHENHNRNLLQRTIDMILEIHSRLQSWYTSTEMQLHDSMLERGMEHGDAAGFANLETWQLPSSVMRFSSCCEAIMLSTYWVAMMSLNWNLADAMSKCSSHLHNCATQNPVIIEAHESAFHYATMVHESLQYLLELDICGISGRIATTYYLRIIQQYFEVAGLHKQHTSCTELQRYLHFTGLVTDFGSAG